MSIPLSDLKLDLNNPRLPKSKQGKDEKTVIEWMLLEAATLELMLAIAENDFFAGESRVAGEKRNQIGSPFGYFGALRTKILTKKSPTELGYQLHRRLGNQSECHCR